MIVPFAEFNQGKCYLRYTTTSQDSPPELLLSPSGYNHLISVTVQDAKQGNVTFKPYGENSADLPCFTITSEGTITITDSEESITKMKAILQMTE